MTPDKPIDAPDANKASGKTESRPEIYAISRDLSGWTLSRRSLMSAAAVVAAVPQRAEAAAACATGAWSHTSNFDSVAINLWSLPDGRLLPVRLMDPAASDSSPSGATYAQ